MLTAEVRGSTQTCYYQAASHASPRCGLLLQMSQKIREALGTSVEISALYRSFGGDEKDQSRMHLATLRTCNNVNNVRWSRSSTVTAPARAYICRYQSVTICSFNSVNLFANNTLRHQCACLGLDRVCLHESS